MTKLYHRKQGKDKNGNPKVDKAWTGTFRLPSGYRASIALFEDAESSNAAAKAINQMIDRAATNRELSRELWDFAANTDARLRQRLVDLRIAPAELLAAATTVEKLIDDWDATRVSKDGPEGRSQKQSKENVIKICKGCGWRQLSDINPLKVEKFLVSRDKSARTFNHWLTNAKTFLNWCVAQHFIQYNPLDGIKQRNVALDRRRVRRALTEDQIKHLLETTLRLGLFHHRLHAYERVLLYRLDIEGGPRWNEVYKLKRSAFHLDEDVPFVMLQAKSTKNGKTEPVPLSRALAADLKAYFDAKPDPEDRAFPTWQGKGANMLREDLEAAGIPYEDAEGNVVDFHGLRTTCCSRYLRNKSSAVVTQKVMRHGDLRLTTNTYGDITLPDKSAALEALPDLPALGPDLVNNLVNNSSQNQSRRVRKKNNSDTQTTNEKSPKTQGFRASSVGREKGLEPSAFRATICGPVENEPVNHGISEDHGKLSQQISQQAAEAAKMASYIEEGRQLREDMARMGADMAALDKTINYLTRALENLAAQLSPNNQNQDHPALALAHGGNPIDDSAAMSVASNPNKEEEV